jgi:hypothetical protein
LPRTKRDNKETIAIPCKINQNPIQLHWIRIFSRTTMQSGTFQVRPVSNYQPSTLNKSGDWQLIKHLLTTNNPGIQAKPPANPALKLPSKSHINPQQTTNRPETPISHQKPNMSTNPALKPPLKSQMNPQHAMTKYQSCPQNHIWTHNKQPTDQKPPPLTKNPTCQLTQPWSRP